MSMRVERRIVVAGTLIVVVMALVAAIPWVMNVQLEAAFGALADVAARERAYESLLDTFAAIDHDRRAYLLTGRGVFLQSPAAALAALAPIRQRLQGGAHDGDERATLRVIERDLDAELAGPRRDAVRVARLRDRIAAEIARERAERTRWHDRVIRDSRFASRSAIAAAVAEALILAAALRAAGRAMLALRRAADEADARSRLLHRLQCAASLDETPAILGAALAAMYPGAPGAFYLRRVGHDRLERRAAWGSTQWPEQLPTTLATPGPLPGNDVPAPACCQPLLAQGALIGAVCLGIPAQACDGIARLGEQVALALANIELRERLRHQSLVDPLTQLYNRRFLADAFERELERARRAQAPVSVVLIDLDHFKRINDVHGHDTGDAVLAMVGTLLREAVRGADVACRYGGEEMLVVLPGCGFADALERAEELRRRIAGLAVGARGGQVGISASFGVASYPEHGATPAQLVAAADGALYAAKREGRDRVAGAAQLHTLRVSDLVG